MSEDIKVTNVIAAYGSELMKIAVSSDISTIFNTLDANKLLGHDEVELITSDDADPFAKSFYRSGLVAGISLAMMALVRKAAETESITLPEDDQ